MTDRKPGLVIDSWGCLHDKNTIRQDLGTMYLQLILELSQQKNVYRTHSSFHLKQTRRFFSRIVM